ncbi:uncharacterized protein [Argopecten irradians]|uniref:uncharacterized protein n=1 Tax=Argopecten irradians TaxID=31199 RepID=UPI003719E5A4
MACREPTKQETNIRASNQRRKNKNKGKRESSQITSRLDTVACPWCCSQVQQVIRHMTSECIVRFDYFKSEDKPEVKKRIAEKDFNFLKEGQENYYRNLYFSAEELAERLGESHIGFLPKLIECLLDFGHILVPHEVLVNGGYQRSRFRNGLVSHVTKDYLMEKYGTKVSGAPSSTIKKEK